VNNFLSQLNLTPQERRIVVVIFLVVIVVLNLLFVWPRFGDWGRINKQLEEMRRTEETYNRDIQLDLNPTNAGGRKLKNWPAWKGGSKIDTPVDPQNQLQQTIIQQERKTGVTVGSFSPARSKRMHSLKSIPPPLPSRVRSRNWSASFTTWGTIRP